MSVARVEVLVEEPSAEAALNVLLERILGRTSFRVHAFTCKTEMLKRLPQRLQGYASWLPDDSRILVVVDRDDDDCLELKGRLERMAREAGLGTRAGGGRLRVVNRVVIEEHVGGVREAPPGRGVLPYRPAEDRGRAAHRRAYGPCAQHLAELPRVAGGAQRDGLAVNRGSSSWLPGPQASSLEPRAPSPPSTSP